jgi:hypothetical protein
MMLEELERRNYSDKTIRYYVRFVERFARHFGKSPDKLGLEHVRSYQAYLLKQRRLSPRTVENHVAALRFFFVHTLGRMLQPLPRSFHHSRLNCFHHQRRKNNSQNHSTGVRALFNIHNPSQDHRDRG